MSFTDKYKTIIHNIQKDTTCNSQWFTIALIAEREQKGMYQNICGGRMYSFKNIPLGELYIFHPTSFIIISLKKGLFMQSKKCNSL